MTPSAAFPLRFRGGRTVTVEQGSAEHVIGCAEVVLRTPVGAFEHDPKFGLRELVHRLGPVAPAIDEALATFEPRRRFLTDEDASQLAERIRRVDVQAARGES